jgi:predicted dehydrogenase/threonine dehydrogenase-like Zn-dependent dehydrogenase
MLAVLTDSKTGKIIVNEIPTPELQPGGILVQTHFSVVSSGTERAKIETGEKSLLGKARARPDLVRQVVDYARANGVLAAYKKVKTRLDTLAPLGYSCSGVVLEVGEGVAEFRPGDRVACGGVGYANHCEVNFVPRNLAVHVPEAVDLEQAAITTIGAIALQGLRQAEIRFGETVVVIGAGLVGVLAVQLAKAAGCRVVAVDVDRTRVDRAIEFGAQAGVIASEPRAEEIVKAFSRYGADAAVITAAARSSEPLELATRLLRDRGRIVVVGDVGLGVARASLYNKELSLALSRSYGPGRYDPAYEERGLDYPIGYVRWTERRNMEAFLDALASGAIDVRPLLERQRPAEEAPQAYEELLQGNTYTVLIRYSAKDFNRQDIGVAAGPPRLVRQALESVCVGSIGAGSFARGTILPYLRKVPGVVMEAVATASGIAAESARSSVGFRRALSPGDLLADPLVNTVFVLTRHDSHARYVVEALARGKAIFIEKPLCVQREELHSIQDSYAEQAAQGSEPFLMVGFNRRFSPHTEKIREFFAGRREPMMVHIRVNAGYIPQDHWAQQATGGRIVGEVCHFVDWARSVVGKPIRSVWATALPDGTRYHQDNLAVLLMFADGSVANLLYMANGDKSIQKELFEVFCEGSVARLNDFRLLELVRKGRKQTVKSAQDKGHRKELEQTVNAIRLGHPSPIPFDELCEVSEATFQIVDALGKPLAGVATEAPVNEIAVGSMTPGE